MRTSSLIVAHNINFDITYLKVEAFRNGLGGFIIP